MNERVACHCHLCRPCDLGRIMEEEEMKEEEGRKADPQDDDDVEESLD